MSRIGKQPIVIPAGVEVTLDSQTVRVKGPKGNLSVAMHNNVRVSLHDGDTGKEVHVAMSDLHSKLNRSLWGMARTLIMNMMLGVTQGFEKQLEINGVGYKVALQGSTLKFEVGFSHSVEYKLPESISAKVEKNLITITGIDKYLVGQTAASIRSIKKPEPYKGKGIKYVDEVVRRKAGKAAKASA